jgi:hypothetical protein
MDYVGIAFAGTSISRRFRSATACSLTIYNSEDITLVRETRTVTFKQGHQPAAVFSWANTLIDPTSVAASSSSRKPGEARGSRHDLPAR